MRKHSMVVIFCCMLLLMACGKKAPDDDGAQEGNDVNQTTDDLISPYTGVATEELQTERAVAVMVSNQVQDRPQSGLTNADIVYEILVEGNITRFMAIYQSDPPEVVGPVRSAREYFFTLAQGYDAIYIYSGAANFVNDMIKDRNIDHLQGAMYDNDGNLFVREDFRRTPHNLYLQFGAVHDVAADKGYQVELEHEALLFLDEEEEVPGEAANYVKLDYYGDVPIVEFNYDAAAEKYTRYNDQEATVELDTEAPIQIDNLFIVEAEHEIFDDAGRRKIDLDSGGTGYLLQKGQVQYVEWENRDGRILPVKDGEVLPLVPGQTWISFVQKTPQAGVKQQVMIENK